MSEYTDRCGAGHPEWQLSCCREPHDGGSHEGYGETWTDPDPDELGTFGEYLDAYTARGGMTDDERTAYWMRWTKETIVWAFAVAGALIVKGMYGGPVDLIVTAIVAVGVIALGWQGFEAVRFARRARRGR